MHLPIMMIFQMTFSYDLLPIVAFRGELYPNELTMSDHVTLLSARIKI